MDKQEAKTKLGTLSEREREVLTLFCQGKAYSEIASKLYLAERTVRVHMGNIYTKLGLRAFKASARRRELLHELFCPLLKEELPPPAPESKELVALTPELEEQIDEDEYTLVRAEPVVIDLPPTRRQRRGCLGIWALLLIVFGLGIGATIFALNWMGLLGGVTVQVSPSVTSGELIQASGQTPEPPVASPTQTSAPSATNTLQPSSTPLPTPTPMPLPFLDDFNNGAKSEWEVVVGNWRMVDGAYLAGDIDDWNVSLVGSESWQNIVIDVDAITDNWNYSMRVIVRAYQGTYLVMDTNCCYTYFILVQNGEETVIAEAEARGLTGSIDWHTNHLRIEARDNIYTVYSDGKKLLTVQDNTLPSGRVGLSLYYERSRFDNFSVQQLN